MLMMCGAVCVQVKEWPKWSLLVANDPHFPHLWPNIETSPPVKPNLLSLIFTASGNENSMQ